MQRRDFLKIGALAGAAAVSGCAAAPAASVGTVPAAAPPVATWVDGAGGTRLFVESVGRRDRPAILFIHGFSQCRLSWTRQFESPLADRFRLVRMDLRGHGRSDKPRDPAAYQEGRLWADDVDAVIRALDLRRPVLCGWSFGGFVLCDYVRHHGQTRLGGLNFVSAATERGYREAAADYGRDFLKLFAGLLSNDATDSAAALHAFVEMMTHEPLDWRDFYLLYGFNAAVPAYVRQAMAQPGAPVRNADLLARLEVPVLVTHGLADRCVLAAASERLVRVVPRAARAFYERCGHAPFFEAAGRYNSDLAAFVEAT